MDVVVLGIMAFFFVFIGVMIALVIRQYRRENALAKALNLQGTSVTGHMIKHRVKEVGSSCHCYLTYQYMFEGTDYEYEQHVKAEGFNAVRDGETVTILLLPQNPSTPRLAPIRQFQFP